MLALLKATGGVTSWPDLPGKSTIFIIELKTHIVSYSHGFHSIGAFSICVCFSLYSKQQA